MLNDEFMAGLVGLVVPVHVYLVLADWSAIAVPALSQTAYI